MQPSYDEVGIEGSPVRLPAWCRRAMARFVSFHPSLLSVVLWLLHRVWALGKPFQANQIAKDWCRLAGQFELEQTSEFSLALKTLDQLPLFREGCRKLGFRNCSEVMFYKGGFLDPFFDQGRWSITNLTHPHQRPHYFVPGIPAQRYYDPKAFRWTEILEESFLVIQEELLDLLRSEDVGFGNYRTEYGNVMPGWNTFHFWLQGEKIEENCRRCPKTTRILESLPGMEREFILFSALNPKYRIVPHVGAVNGILRFHLPLLVPEGCGLRVGGETATWQEGKVLVFDDSFVHDVWNDSDQLRVVLFINAWHPSLSAEEQDGLARLQRAYDRTPFGKNWKQAQMSLPPSSLDRF
jgi:aspartyl/asparaginyl beta-hydroxylase